MTPGASPVILWRKSNFGERTPMPDDDSARDELIQQLVMRSIALRDVIAVLLAMQALASPDPENLFRVISDGLDQRLDQMKTVPAQMPMVEQIRSEVDWILDAARKLSVGKK